MKRWQVLLGALAMLALYGWVGSMDRADAEAERSHYCEMVEAWEQSGGEYGWPPYDGKCEGED